MTAFLRVLAAALVLSGLYAAWAQRGAPTPPREVSLVQLLAAPERYHGKRVEVVGFLRLEFEGDALYLHAEDYRYSLTRNGLWVDRTKEMGEHQKELDRRYVRVEGTFDARRTGHMGLWSGALREVRRCTVYSIRGREIPADQPRPLR